MENEVDVNLRRPVIGLLVLLLAVAMLPWWSGGTEPLGRVIAANTLLLGSILIWIQPQTRTIGWRSPLTLSGLALLAWATVSLTWSVNRYQTELWLLGLIGAYAAFSLAYRLADSATGRAWVQQAYLTVATVSSIYGFWIYYTDDYNRLTSAFFWANPMAGFLLPAVIFGLDYIAGTGRRWWLWIATAINVVAFWLTQSRGASLILVFGIVVLIWRQLPNRGYWLRLVATLIATFLLSTLFVQLWHLNHTGQDITTISSRFTAASTTDSSSVSSRVDFLSSAGRIWFDHPFAGTGAGTFASVHPQYQGKVIAASTDAHNWYLQTLSELGLMGLVLVGLVALSLIAGIRRGLTVEPKQAVWVLGITALVLHLGLDIDGQYPVILVIIAAGYGLVWRPAPTELHHLRASLALPVLLVGMLTLASSANSSQLLAAQAAAAQVDGNLSDAADLYLQGHQTVVFDPALVQAEGIDYYSLALNGTNARDNYALALDRAKDAEKLAPDSAQNYQLEGRVYLAQKNYQAAIAPLRKALQLDPYNQPSYAQDLAVALHNTGDTTQALVVTQTMLTQYDDAVLKNRSSDQSVGQAVYALWLYQEFLHDAVGNTAAAKHDHAEALHLVGSR